MKHRLQLIHAWRWLFGNMKPAKHRTLAFKLIRFTKISAKVFNNKLPASQAPHSNFGCLAGLIVGGRTNLAMAQPTWTLFVGLKGNCMLPSSVRAQPERRDFEGFAYVCLSPSLALMHG